MCFEGRDVKISNHTSVRVRIIVNVENSVNVKVNVENSVNVKVNGRVGVINSVRVRVRDKGLGGYGITCTLTEGLGLLTVLGSE